MRGLTRTIVEREAPRVESVHVPEHTTERLTIPAEGGDWVVTSIRSGCLRIQRGDFCAYIPWEGQADLIDFIGEHMLRYAIRNGD